MHGTTLCWASLLCLWLVGCGAKAGPEASSPGASSPRPAATAGMAADPAPTAEAMPKAMPKAVPMGKNKGPEPTPTTDETMITVAPDQCDDLRRTLASIVTREGTDKQDPNLEGAQREKYEKSVRTTAESVSREFGQNCDQNLVGKEMPRKMLKCMFEARTMVSFDQCTAK